MPVAESEDLDLIVEEQLTKQFDVGGEPFASREVVTELSVDVDVTLHIETDSELDEEVKRMKETVDETIKPIRSC